MGDPNNMAAAREPAGDRSNSPDGGERLGLIAHDLRAPLSMIAACVKSLERRADTLPDDLRRTLTIIAHNTHALETMVAELVDGSPVVHPVAHLRIRCTSLATFLELVLDQTLDGPERARVRVESFASPVVDIDPEKIERVVVNLVRNALVHAPGSPITVLVDTEDGRALVSVIDRGPGIPAAALDSLFDGHPRIPASPHAGLGLGLYICRLLVEAHGGTIGVSSRPGSGTAFWFRLPLAVDQDTATPRFARGTGVVSRYGHLAGRRVIAVDDELAQVEAVAQLLRDEGLVVDTATNGAQLLQRCRHVRPDLVIVDVIMGGLSGTELVQRLRAELPGLPVILVSGLPASHPRVRDMVALPRVAHVEKPIEMEAMLATISGLLRA